MKNYIVYLIAALTAVPCFAGGAWKGQIPPAAQDSSQWAALLPVLKKSELPYGAMAAAARMLSFFNELESKQTAYTTIVELVDQGYPFSRTDIDSNFIPGDIEPQGDPNFVNSYNLFKFMTNHEKGMERWAHEYYKRLTGDGFGRYQFHLAVEAYAQGKLDDSVEILRRILAQQTGTDSGALAIHTARTLARIYYEQKQYAASLDIYRAFLLRLNPLTPNDWLEAAWNEYHLKHYPEAIGLIYNLESRAAEPLVSLEKYMLRALIYRENCAVTNAQALTESLDGKFGTVVDSLKLGVSPVSLPILARLQLGETSPYQRTTVTLERLQKESAHLKDKVPPPQRALAQYLYDSEIQLVALEQKTAAEVASQKAARQLVMLAEQLRFLKFDVAREKYDPDRVFRASGVAKPQLVADASSDVVPGFKVTWPEQGDFWRNERMKFKGALTQQCE